MLISLKAKIFTELSRHVSTFFKILYWTNFPPTDGSITVHRADTLKVLTDSLSKDVGTHFMKQLVGYVQNTSGVITMSFADGTTAEADIVVGADGLKSVTREVMYRNFADAAKGHDEIKAQNFESFIQPTWSGMYAYRALIDSEKLHKIAPGHQSISKAILVSNRIV